MRFHCIPRIETIVYEVTYVNVCIPRKIMRIRVTKEVNFIPIILLTRWISCLTCDAAGRNYVNPYSVSGCLHSIMVDTMSASSLNDDELECDTVIFSLSVTYWWFIQPVFFRFQAKRRSDLTVTLALTSMTSF